MMANCCYLDVTQRNIISKEMLYRNAVSLRLNIIFFILRLNNIFLLQKNKENRRAGIITCIDNTDCDPTKGFICVSGKCS